MKCLKRRKKLTLKGGERLTYEEFLKTKERSAISSGFTADRTQFNKHLFPFQADILYWALRKGRCALFEDCGMGKAIQSLEWGRNVVEHTGKPVLFVCPLSVAEQTKREADKFGIPNVKVVRDQSQIITGVNVTNYEMLDHFDGEAFSGVILDECFAPDTMIEVVTNSNEIVQKQISEIQPNDKIRNCTGIDKVVAVRKKKVPYAIRIGFNGRKIICSPRHPFFTQRGWVCAKELQESDAIIATDKAMRILRGEFSNNIQVRFEETFLQSVLFCEMENVSTRVFSESTHGGSTCQDWRKSFYLASDYTGRAEECRENKKLQFDEKSRNEGKSICYIEENAPRTFKAWGKWDRSDIAAAVDDGCFARELGNGITYISGQETARLPDELQGRLRELGFENCNRSGWEHSPYEKRARQKEGRKTGFFGLESFEVLEPGCSELDRYRDATGTLYFYDIEVEQHPSFTINGCLVHNSAILKNYSGKTRTEIIEKFRNTPYKLSCTATPAPNDYMELGNQAEFLGVMSRTEMLATYFTHDGGETSKWRLKGHAQDKFWEWLATWAVVLTKPSDLGYEDDGYVLPDLISEQITIRYDENIVDDNYSLFADVAQTLNERRNARRNSLVDRCKSAADLIAEEPEEQWLVWCDLNAEADELRHVIPNAVEVRGTDEPDIKADRLNRFTIGEIRYLIVKPSIAAWGLNWQNCHNMIFVGLSDSFEMMYQAIRRCWRFGQEYPVNVYIITSEAEGAVKDNIERKEKQAKAMTAEMVKHTKEILEEEIRGTKRITIPYNPQIEMIIPEWLVSA